MKSYFLPIAVLFAILLVGFTADWQTQEKSSVFYVIQDEKAETISVFRKGGKNPVLTQNAKAGMRPYLHPIMAPDGRGSLTEYSPSHHKHQTGLYWGFTRVNGSGAPADTLRKWFYNPNKPQHIRDQIGRDFFHYNGESHWKKVSAQVVADEGEMVKWQTVYHMLDENSHPILEETMNWSFHEEDNKYLIGLEWQGKAIVDITINAFSYGGMFLRMPWYRGISGEAINSEGQRNQEAEGQTAKWVDVGMDIESRDDWGHIAIFDHPQNSTYPTPWRVDGQLGIGPCRAIVGDWFIKKGDTEVIKHQLVAYTGELMPQDMDQLWNTYASKMDQK